MEVMVTAKGLNKKFYFPPDFWWDLFREVDLTVYKGEFAVITGSSGSGKSTLLNILLGLDKEAQGTVTIDKKEITALDAIELERFHRENISMCIENTTTIELGATVEDNIISQLNFIPRNCSLEEVSELLNLFGLEKIVKQQVFRGSNDYYRLMLALAFVGFQKLIIIDEVLEYLPDEDKKKLLNNILLLKKQKNFTVIMVTQDIDIIKQADRAFCLKDQTIYNIDLNKLHNILNKNLSLKEAENG